MKISLDRWLLAIMMLLVIFGVAMVYSAGQTDSVDPRHAWIRTAWLKQLVWMGVAVGVGTIVFRTSSRIIEWAAAGLYGLGLILLSLTLFIGSGSGTAASTKSWLKVGGVTLGQPVELAKLGCILLLAKILTNRKRPPDSVVELVLPVGIALAPAIVAVLGGDLGSAIMFAGILFAMLFWAGVRPVLLLFLASPIVSLLTAASTAWWAVWIVGLTIMILLWRPYFFEGLTVWLVNCSMGIGALKVWNKLAPHQQKRLTSFLDPEKDPRFTGFNLIQSKVAIGSGGFLGAGWLMGPQKRLAYIPERATDFIFSVVGEELGFVGVTVALVLFLLLFLRLITIARRATSAFGGMVVFGVLGLLFTHVWENIGMTIQVMPITGVPLPFFSYGGSFVLACGISMGLVFRVAWESRQSGYID